MAALAAHSLVLAVHFRADAVAMRSLERAHEALRGEPEAILVAADGARGWAATRFAWFTAHGGPPPVLRSAGASDAAAAAADAGVPVLRLEADGAVARIR